MVAENRVVQRRQATLGTGWENPGLPRRPACGYDGAMSVTYVKKRTAAVVDSRRCDLKKLPEWILRTVAQLSGVEEYPRTSFSRQCHCFRRVAATFLPVLFKPPQRAEPAPKQVQTKRCAVTFQTE